MCFLVSEDEKPWLKYMRLNVEFWESKGREAESKNISQNESDDENGSSNMQESKEDLDVLIRKEEQRVDNLNQDESSDYISLFMVI